MKINGQAMEPGRPFRCAGLFDWPKFKENTMSVITGLTKNGREWTPEFIKTLEKDLCIGCGRCYKSCTKDVLAYEEVDTEETVKAYMKIANDGNCIGCKACGQNCPKGCFSFEPVEARAFGYTS
jgi:Nif-specific ferredoxin III